ncbi:Rieske 2Fe-2S domain-containing protein [Xanthobacter cornucopiae]|uniref:Rieske 2Fe-2S domain-containing protein n=1 Tax=Xanthobacter cornucopiae TaxID=3119924 RepID=UPI00372D06CB
MPLLAVWPQGAAGRVLPGTCPHTGALLTDADFDGRVLTCRAHEWMFDAASGLCIRGRPCALASYPVEARGDTIFVRTDGVVPHRRHPDRD